MSFWKAQPSSKLGRAIVTQVTTTLVNASVTTQTLAAKPTRWDVSSPDLGYHRHHRNRHCPKLGHMVATSSPEYFAVTRGQQLNFISTSKSTGWVVLTEMS